MRSAATSSTIRAPRRVATALSLLRLALAGHIALGTVGCAGRRAVDARCPDSATQARDPLAESALAEIAALDPVLRSPAATCANPQELSNGAVAVEASTERGGAVILRLSHVDAFSEVGRALVFGELRLSCDPPLPTTRFLQRHARLDGSIEIEFLGESPDGTQPADGARVLLAVDPGSPHIAVALRSRVARTCEIRLERWRDAERLVEAAELPRWAACVSDGASAPWSESADIVVPVDAEPDALVWYHRNERSVMHAVLEARGLGEIATEFEDPFLMRTFGARVDAHGFSRVDERTLRSDGPLLEANATVTMSCVQADDMGGWLRRLRVGAGLAPRSDESLATAADWWRDRWARGWVLFEGPAGDAAAETEDRAREVEAHNAGLVAQRVALLARGRGAWPAVSRADPAVVRWAEWCASLRASIALGDTDRVEAALESFARVVTALRAATRATHSLRGVLVPETTTVFGLDAGQAPDRASSTRTTIEIAELFAGPCAQSIPRGRWIRCAAPFLHEVAVALADAGPQFVDDEGRARVARIARDLESLSGAGVDAGLQERWRLLARSHAVQEAGGPRHGSAAQPGRIDGALGSVAPLLAEIDSLDRAVCVLPAWPRAWNASFRLHVCGGDPGRLRISGRVRGGAVTTLFVEAPAPEASSGEARAAEAAMHGDPATTAAGVKPGPASIRLGSGWTAPVPPSRR